MYKADFGAIAEAVHEDKNFCVGCLQVREDVPVSDNLCLECGNERPEETLH